MYAQSVAGQIVEEGTNEPIIGASVFVKGTTIGTITDIDGRFTLQTGDVASPRIEIAYLGYKTIYISPSDFNNPADLGVIALSSSALGMEEVTIVGVADIVTDRQTPVAVSTISTAEIQAKSGNVEFPELMKATPSIYVANQSSGYGDAEVYTRGFDQTNTAFLLNGQPINGMEDGKMYWSNWSGMSDVASAIQVQRGLGSSKLAISSVGGTTNIVMKTTDQEESGTASLTYGNDNYIKATASYNTGMINDKFGVTFLLTHWQGDGWADGTKGQGQNYFLSAGYQPNDNHNFNFLITGAPQWHDQNRSKLIKQFYVEDKFNIKHNNNWGTLNNEYLSARRNFYHKPVANINWDWSISDVSKLNTVLYGSWGRGGGSGPIGSWSNYAETDKNLIDFDKIVENNKAGDNEWVLRNSVNNHAWYGLVTRFDQMLNEYFDFSIGADVRTYHGSHFRELRDLLGASAYSQKANARFDAREVTTTFKANPWSALTSYADQKDQIGYSNDETITYGGLFSQLEFSTNRVSAYVQGALSNQSHVRYELFKATKENEKSEGVNNLGYNIKSGASYSIDNNHTIFANAGYYSRQPFHDNIYLNYSNTLNKVAKNEKIIGFEAGYKFSGKDIAFNFNAYHTAWNDRTTTKSVDPGETIDGFELPQGGFINQTNVNQLHKGLELDLRYNLNDLLFVKGFGSLGDWKYKGNAKTELYDDSRKLLNTKESLKLDGIHIGGSAQTSFGVGVGVKPVNNLKVTADFYNYSRLYSNLRTSSKELQLPSYNLIDMGISYRLPIATNLVILRANVYNLLGTEYISKSTTAVKADDVAENNWNGINKDNKVQFGKTRTWNVSLKYAF